MSAETLSSVLLAGIAINLAVMLVWFGAWTFAGDSIYRMHTRWFRIERSTYDAITFVLLGGYKIGTWLFFVVPWIALQMVSAS